MYREDKERLDTEEFGEPGVDRPDGAEWDEMQNPRA